MKRGVPWLWLAILLPLQAHATQADQVKASHGWIRLLPADLPAAGYVTLDNQGSSAATLVSARSAFYASVMLHQSATDTAGGSSMRMLDRLTIPAHGEVSLAPAGFHLMLQEATHPYKPGQTIDVTLDFADGSHLRVPFMVRPANAPD
ncbi:copper chaperone PCu(A)C [Dyella choica]|uniref:Copper chaperone PCu(A)C n=1 Tax=Dyella choica TaxID=1927959 RepID=A0A3S0SCU6_9GAMM|nr:copper chaperone PCu(A)C [Dyella choica]RUL80026.1 copper chaperone PCu(A)C [Dyella choica]